jgi:predicted permease
MSTRRWRRGRRDEDFDAEIRAHVEAEAERLREEGVSTEHARTEARRAFGNITRVREQFYESRHWMGVERLILDARYALRMLRKSPAFAAASLVTLALAIGANTAMFTVVNAVLLRPLPYPDPGALVSVIQTGPGGPDFATWPDYVDWRDRNSAFEHLAGAWDRTYNLTGIAEPERLRGAAVTTNLFATLRVPPALGRTFNLDAVNDPQTVVLSHSLWVRRFGAAETAIGRSVLLNGRTYTVIGVMPAGFAWPSTAELWEPFVPDAAMGRGYHLLQVVGRLKPARSLTLARAELETIAASAALTHAANKDWSVHATSLLDFTVASTRQALSVLTGAVGCVLLIACANIAGLLGSRAAARHREISLRSALGASRGRICRQLLTESLLLSIAGGALGLGLAVLAIEPLLALTPLPRAQEVSVDGMVLLITVSTSAITGLLFGVAPALSASRVDLRRALTLQGSGSTARLRPGLLVAEVAVAIVLLAGAGLLLRSFHLIQRLDTGIDSERLLTVRLFMPRASYPVERCVQLYQEIVDRLKGLAGVDGAAAISAFPFSGAGANLPFGLPSRPASGQMLTADVAAATPGYFRTVGITLLAGRDIGDQDRADSAPVVVINRAMVDRFFGEENPIGRFIAVMGPTPRTIVGVVENARARTLQSPFEPGIYLPHTQWPTGNMFLAVRSRSLEPARLAAPVRAQLRAIDPDLPLASVRTADNLLEQTLSSRRFSLLLLSIFAGTALILAVVGVYAVVAFNVALQTREVGIRVALGASRRDVLWLVIRQGMAPVLAGLGIGLLGALAFTRVLATMLYEVRPTDPIAFAGGTVLLLVTALAAVAIPARRAASADPLTSLQES